MNIIVVSITPYKEKDAIVEGVNQDELITFLAKGIFDPKNKNSAINTTFVKANIDLQEGNYKYPVLKSVNNVINPMQLNSDLDYLSSLLIANECFKNLLQDEEKIFMFTLLNKFIDKMKSTDNPLLLTLSFVSQILRVAGYEFETSSCVFCGSKKGIVSFSFNDGGFVCQECANMDTPRDLTNEQMLLIRNVIGYKGLIDESKYYSRANAITLFKKFNHFIQESIGFNIKSFSLLNN